jgi:hypothetical protein
MFIYLFDFCVAISQAGFHFCDHRDILFVANADVGMTVGQEAQLQLRERCVNGSPRQCSND